MLNKIGASIYYCPLPGLRGIVSDFSQPCIFFAGGCLFVCIFVVTFLNVKGYGLTSSLLR